MYITVAELNTIMPSIFLSSELSIINWDKVPDSDKNALISRSGAFLESLKYKGTYKEPYQTTQFPRIIKGVVIEVNENIKNAQVCVVYELLANKVDVVHQLQEQGQTSENALGVSASYDLSKFEVIRSRYYKQYIDKYLFKGVL